MEPEKIAFFDMAERFLRATDHAEQKRLKEELARMTFGDSTTEAQRTQRNSL